MTPGSLIVEVGDDSQNDASATDAPEGTPGNATGRSYESALSDVTIATRSTLNVGFHSEPSRLETASADADEENSPLPGRSTAVGMDRILRHPISDLQYSTPTNRSGNSDQDEHPYALSGEVDTGAIATSEKATNNPPERGAVADSPTPSPSPANEAAFDSGPPGETYSRLPINRLGHQPSGEPHLYQGGPLYQQMAAALQSPPHGLNSKAKSRKGAKAMDPKYHPYNFRTNARGKTYDEDTESD